MHKILLNWRLVHDMSKCIPCFQPNSILFLEIPFTWNGSFPTQFSEFTFLLWKKKTTVLESTFIISFILTSCYSNENESLHKVNSPFCLITFFYILFFFLAALFSFPSSQLHAFSKAHSGNICVHSCLLNYALCFFFFFLFLHNYFFSLWRKRQIGRRKKGQVYFQCYFQSWNIFSLWIADFDKNLCFYY